MSRKFSVSRELRVVAHARHQIADKRGIYRALVAARARQAAVRDARYVMVDASDDSAPILCRLGLKAVTTTTPYVWTPLSAPN